MTSPSEEKKAYLQVFVDEKGNVLDLSFYTYLNSIIPESIEEQDIFTGANGVGLGSKTFSLWKDQLAATGIAVTTLDAIFENGTDELVFTRDIGQGEFVKPFLGTEVRIDDSKGVTGMEQDIYFMLYTRNLANDREFLMITTSIVHSINGSDQRSINVEFMIGIPIELGRVVVQ